jgi:ubiquitin carboxyl-terminal hydrolase 4/11/15
MHELPTDVVQSQRGITANMSKTLVIPVYSMRKSSESYNSQQLMGFGSPFFIAISKSQASNPEAIWDAVMTRYANSVDHEAEDALWVSSPAESSVDDQLAEGVVEDVTGLHIAENETPENSTSEGPIDSQTTASSQPGEAKRLRHDLFKLTFASAGAGDSDQKSVIFKGTPKRTHTLEERRHQKRSMLSQVTSAIQKNFSRPGSDDEDEAGPDVILKQGDAIFCEWEAKEARHLFNASYRGRYSTEDAYVSVVDPAIKVEEKKFLERKKRGISLDDCLDEFERIETLGENDLWYCSNVRTLIPSSAASSLTGSPIVQETPARLQADGNLPAAGYPCHMHEAIRLRRLVQEGAFLSGSHLPIPNDPCHRSTNSLTSR